MIGKASMHSSFEVITTSSKESTSEAVEIPPVSNGPDTTSYGLIQLFLEGLRMVSKRPL
jgi:hypothetical protein